MNVSFSDDTIGRLADWLLSCAANPSATGNSRPQEFGGIVTQLERSDPQFQAWLNCQASEPGDQLDSHGNWPSDNAPHSTDDVQRGWLIRRLLCDTSWAANCAAWQVKPVDDPKSIGDQRAILELRLWHTLLVYSRLDALQSTFVKELDRSTRETLYHMAYGLSHEINNPLANIATRANVLAAQESVTHRRQMLVSIVDQAMRGSEMLADLMLVARPPRLTFEPLDLTKLLRNIIDKANPWSQSMNVRIVADKSIEIEAIVHADCAALTEALWCVLRNGIEATYFSAHAKTAANDQAAPEDNVRISVRVSKSSNRHFISTQIKDDGNGLSAEALKNCLNPFYSGREAGRGLGVGLAKVKRIVELHHGTIQIANAPSGGCIAAIILPLVAESVGKACRDSNAGPEV